MTFIKKSFCKYKVVLVLMVAALLLGLPAFASTYTVNDDTYLRFIDEYLGLSDEQANDINLRIDNFIKKHGVDLAFVFTKDYVGDYAEGDSTFNFADFLDIVYESNKYGVGEHNAGIIIGFDSAANKYFYDFMGESGSERYDVVMKAVDVVVKNIYVEYDYNGEYYNGLLNSIELLDVAFDNISDNGAEDNRAIDFARLLSDSEQADLEARIQKFREKHKMDMVFFSGDRIDFSQNRLNDGSSGTFRQFVEDFYDYLGFGYKSGYDGFIFALSMQGGAGNRDYCALTTGKAEGSVSNSKLEQLVESECLPKLKSGEYYKAVLAFIDGIESVMDGSYDRKAAFQSLPKIFGISAVLALFITAITALAQRNVTKKSRAAEYIVPGTVDINERADYYINTTVTRTKIKSEDKGGGSVGSSGRSHGGTSGKF